MPKLVALLGSEIGEQNRQFVFVELEVLLDA